MNIDKSEDNTYNNEDVDHEDYKGKDMYHDDFNDNLNGDLNEDLNDDSLFYKLPCEEDYINFTNVIFFTR